MLKNYYSQGSLAIIKGQLRHRTRSRRWVWSLARSEATHHGGHLDARKLIYILVIDFYLIWNKCLNSKRRANLYTDRLGNLPLLKSLVTVVKYSVSIILEMSLSKKLRCKIIYYSSTPANLKSDCLLRCLPYVDIFLFAFFRKKFTIHLGKYWIYFCLNSICQICNIWFLKTIYCLRMIMFPITLVIQLLLSYRTIYICTVQYSSH